MLSPTCVFTNSILLCWLFTIKDRCKKCVFYKRTIKVCVSCCCQLQMSQDTLKMSNANLDCRFCQKALFCMDPWLWKVNRIEWSYWPDLVLALPCLSKWFQWHSTIFMSKSDFKFKGEIPRNSDVSWGYFWNRHFKPIIAPTNWVRTELKKNYSMWWNFQKYFHLR